jgi:hypothetical protein
VERSEGDEQPLRIPASLNLALGVAVAGILILGVLATPWFNLTAKAGGF